MKKTALITGGARGIGRETAIALSKEGWRVVINYRSSEKAALSLAEELDAETFRADVSDRGAVMKMFAGYPEVSLLVNNAGTAHYGLFHETSPERANRVLDVNYRGAADCARSALPHMLARKSGCIINVASVWGVYGAAMEADYSAAKAALIGLTKALAKEYGPSGIRVNCVAPGVIETDMLAGFSAADRAELAERTPLGRLGTAGDVANAIAFLASEKAAFITGQTLGVDGGF